jgi:hypothetical protein
VKQSSPAGTIYSYAGGGSYVFEAPQSGILEWKCRPSLAVYPVFAALESPDGKINNCRFYAPRDGKERRFRVKAAPGLWKLSGIFAPMPSNLKVNKVSVKYLSPSREKYFNPDKVTCDNAENAAAKYEVLKYKSFNKSRR